MAVAWIIRQIALKDLGRNYGHEIKLFTEHQLVQHGIYKYMRHPLYLGLCIDTFGATLISFTFLGTFLFVAFLLVIVRRVHLEDTALISRFGEDAKKYHERVPSIRIWPSL
jgi:protein-S-isoprenylcysteine O-methyltransferase Ste14